MRRVSTKREDLKDVFFDFYNSLYTCQQPSEKAMAEVFDGLPSAFTDEMNAELTKPLTIIELLKAIEDMVDGKVLGHDNILIEIFKEC